MYFSSSSTYVVVVVIVVVVAVLPQKYIRRLIQIRSSKTNAEKHCVFSLAPRDGVKDALSASQGTGLSVALPATEQIANIAVHVYTYMYT